MVLTRHSDCVQPKPEEEYCCAPCRIAVFATFNSDSDREATESELQDYMECVYHFIDAVCSV
jgi:hypothetical protein